jgi:TonB family protein
MGCGKHARRRWGIPGLVSMTAHAAVLAASLGSSARPSAALSAYHGDSPRTHVSLQVVTPGHLAAFASRSGEPQGPPIPKPRRARAAHRRHAGVDAAPLALTPIPNLLEPPPFHQDDGGAATPSAGSAPSVAAPASPPPSSPARPISPLEASYLRIDETFPPLPASLLRRGRYYTVIVQLCIDVTGHVFDVSLQRSAAAELDAVVLAALRTWRYRPLVIGGHPQPFCHAMILHYQVD